MIICCGEALVDMLPRKLPTGEDVFLPVSGGALFNTAIALGRLGEDAGFICGISNDMFGEQLIASLKSSNVSTDYCIRNDQPTTLAFVKLTNNQAEYSFFDELSAGRQVSTKDLPALPDDIEAIHFGAISLIPEPSGSAYEALMAREADKRIVSIDPNIRPGFINDAKAHRDRILRMCALADIIKVSDEDLDWVADNKDPAPLVKSWLCEKTSIVIITKGEHGADIYYHGGAKDSAEGSSTNSMVCVPSETANVVDTVGAGDTYTAGFLSELKRCGALDKSKLDKIDPATLIKAGAFAAKVAAVTVSRAGANPPWRNEL